MIMRSVICITIALVDGSLFESSSFRVIELFFSSSLDLILYKLVI